MPRLFTVFVIVGGLLLNVLSDDRKENASKSGDENYGLYGIQVASTLKDNLIKTFGYMLHQPDVNIGVDLYIHLEYVITGLKTNIIDAFDIIPILPKLNAIDKSTQFALLLTFLENYLPPSACQMNCSRDLLIPSKLNLRPLFERLDYNPFLAGVLHTERDVENLRRLARVYDAARNTVPKDEREKNVFRMFGVHILKILREVKSKQTHLTSKLVANFLNFLPWPADDAELNVALADLRQFLNNEVGLRLSKHLEESAEMPLVMVQGILDELLKTNAYPQHVKTAVHVVQDAIKTKLTIPNYRNTFEGDYVDLANIGGLFDVIDHRNYPVEIVIAAKRVRKFFEKIAPYINLKNLNPYMYHKKEEALLELLNYLEAQNANDVIVNGIKAVRPYVAFSVKAQIIDYDLFLSIIDGLTAYDLYAPVKERMLDVRKIILSNSDEIGDILSGKRDQSCAEIISCYNKIVRILNEENALFDGEEIRLHECLLRRSVKIDCEEFTKSVEDDKLFATINYTYYPREAVLAADRIRKHLSMGQTVPKIALTDHQCTTQEMIKNYIDTLANDVLPMDVAQSVKSLTPHLKMQINQIDKITPELFENVIDALSAPDFDENVKQQMSEVKNFVAVNEGLLQTSLSNLNLKCDDIYDCYNTIAKHLNDLKIGYLFPPFHKISPVADFTNRPMTINHLLRLVDAVQSTDEPIELKAAKEYAKDNADELDEYLKTVTKCHEALDCFQASLDTLGNAPNLKTNILGYLLKPTFCDSNECRWIAFEETGSNVLNPTLEYAKYSLEKLSNDKDKPLHIRTDAKEVLQFLETANVDEVMAKMNGKDDVKTARMNFLSLLQDIPTMKSATQRSAENIRTYMKDGENPQTLHTKNLFWIVEELMKNETDENIKQKLEMIEDKILKDRYKLDMLLGKCPVNCTALWTCYTALRKCFKTATGESVANVNELLNLINHKDEYTQPDQSSYMVLNLSDDNGSTPIILDLKDNEVSSALHYLNKIEGFTVNMDDGKQVKLDLNDTLTRHVLKGLAQKTKQVEPIYLPQEGKQPVVALTLGVDRDNSTSILLDTDNDSVMNSLKAMSFSNENNPDAKILKITNKDGSVTSLKLDVKNEAAVKKLLDLSKHTRKIGLPYVSSAPETVFIDLNTKDTGNVVLSLNTSDASVLAVLKDLSMKTKNAANKTTIYVRSKAKILPLSLDINNEEVKNTLLKLGRLQKNEKEKPLVVLTVDEDGINVPIILDTSDDRVLYTLQKLNNTGDAKSTSSIIHVAGNSSHFGLVNLHLKDAYVKKTLKSINTNLSENTAPITIPQVGRQNPIVAVVVHHENQNVPVLLDLNNTRVFDTLKGMSQTNANNTQAKTIYIYDDHGKLKTLRIDPKNENVADKLIKLSKLSIDVESPFVAYPLKKTSLQIDDELGNVFFVTLNTADSKVVDVLKELAQQTVNVSAAKIIYVTEKDSSVTPLAIDVTNANVKNKLFKLGSVSKYETERQSKIVLTVEVENAIKPIILDLNDEVLSVLTKLNASVDENRRVSVVHVEDKTGKPMVLYLNTDGENAKQLLELAARATPYSQPIEIPQSHGRKPYLAMTVRDENNKSVNVLLDLNNEEVMNILNKINVNNTGKSPSNVLYVDETLRIRVDLADHQSVNALINISKLATPIASPFITTLPALSSIQVDDEFGNSFMVTINSTDEKIENVLKSLSLESAGTSKVVYSKKAGSVITLNIDTNNDRVKKFLLKMGRAVPIKTKNPNLVIFTMDNRPIILNLRDDNVMSALKNLNKSVDENQPVTVLHVPDKKGAINTINLNLDSESVKKILGGLETTARLDPVEIPQRNGEKIVAMTIADGKKLRPILLDMGNEQVRNVVTRKSTGKENIYVLNDGRYLTSNLNDTKITENLKQLSKLCSPIISPYVKPMPSNASLRVEDEHGNKFTVTINTNDSTVMQKLKSLETKTPTSIIYAPNGEDVVGVDVTEKNVKQMLMDTGKVVHVSTKKRKIAILMLKDVDGVKPVILDLDDEDTLIKLSNLNNTIDANAQLTALYVKNDTIYLNTDDKNTKKTLEILQGRAFLEPTKIPHINNKKPTVAFTVLDNRGEISSFLLDFNNEYVVDALKRLTQSNADKPEAKVIHVDDVMDLQLDLKNEETLKTLRNLSKQCEFNRAAYQVPHFAKATVDVYDKGYKVIVNLNTSDADVVNDLVDMDLETFDDSPFAIIYVDIQGVITPLTIDPTNENVKNRLLEIGRKVKLEVEDQSLAIFTLKNRQPVILDLKNEHVLSTLKRMNNSADLNAPVTVLPAHENIYLNMNDSKVENILRNLSCRTPVVSKPIEIDQVGVSPMLAFTVSDGNRTVPILLDTSNEQIMSGLKRISAANAHNRDAKIIFVGESDESTPIAVDLNDQDTVKELVRMTKSCANIDTPYVIPKSSISTVQIDEEDGTKLLVTINVTDSIVSDTLKHLSTDETTPGKKTIYINDTNGKTKALSIDFSSRNVREILRDLGRLQQIHTKRCSTVIFTLQLQDETIPIILEIKDEVLEMLKKMNNSVDANSPVTVLHVTDEDENPITFTLNLNDIKTKKLLRSLHARTMNPIEVPQTNLKNPVVAFAAPDRTGKIAKILLDTNDGEVMKALREISCENDDAIYIYVDDREAISLDLKNTTTIEILKKLSNQHVLKNPFVTALPSHESVQIEGDRGNTFIITFDMEDEGVLDVLDDLALAAPGAWTLYVRDQGIIVPLSIDVTKPHVREKLLEISTITEIMPKYTAMIFTIDYQDQRHPVVLDLTNDDVMMLLHQFSNSIDDNLPVQILHVKDTSGNDVTLSLNMDGQNFKKVFVSADLPNLPSFVTEIPQIDRKSIVVIGDGHNTTAMLDLNDEEVLEALRVVSKSNVNNSGALIIHVEEDGDKVEPLRIDMDLNENALKILSTRCASVTAPFITPLPPLVSVLIEDGTNKSVITLNANDSSVVDVLKDLALETTDLSKAAVIYVDRGGTTPLAIDVTNENVKSILNEVGMVRTGPKKKQSTMIFTLQNERGIKPVFIDLNNKTLPMLRHLNETVERNFPVSVLHVKDGTGTSSMISLNLQNINIKTIFEMLAKNSTTLNCVEIPQVGKRPILAMTVHQGGESIPIMLDTSKEKVLNALKGLSWMHRKNPSAEILYVDGSSPIRVDLNDDKSKEVLIQLSKEFTGMKGVFVTPLSPICGMQIDDENGNKFMVDLDTKNMDVMDQIKKVASDKDTENKVYYRDENGRVSVVALDTKNPNVTKTLFDVGKLVQVKLKKESTLVMTIDNEHLILNLDDSVKHTLKQLNNSVDQTKSTTILHLTDKMGSPFKIHLNLHDSIVKKTLKNLQNKRSMFNPFEIPLANRRNPVLAFTAGEKSENVPILLDTNQPELVDALKRMSEKNDSNAKIVCLAQHNRTVIPIALNLHDEGTVRALMNLSRKCPPIKTPFLMPPSKEVTLEIADENGEKSLIDLNLNNATVVDALKLLALESQNVSHSIYVYNQDGGITAIPVDVANNAVKRSIRLAGLQSRIEAKVRPTLIFTMNDGGVKKPVMLDLSNDSVYLALKKLNNTIKENLSVSIFNIPDGSITNNLIVCLDDDDVKKVIKSLAADEIVHPILIPTDKNPTLAMSIRDREGNVLPILLDTNRKEVLGALKEISAANENNINAKIVYVVEDGKKLTPIRVDVNNTRTANQLRTLMGECPILKSPFITPLQSSLPIYVKDSDGSEFIVTVNATDSKLIDKLKKLSSKTDNTNLPVLYVRDKHDTIALPINTSDSDTKNVLFNSGHLTKLNAKKFSGAVLTLNDDGRRTPIILNFEDKNVVQTLRNLSSDSDETSAVKLFHFIDKSKENVMIKLDVDNEHVKNTLKALARRTKTIVDPIEIPQVNGAQPVLAMNFLGGRTEAVPILLDMKNANVVDTLKRISRSNENNTLAKTIYVVQEDAKSVPIRMNFDDETIDLLKNISGSGALETPFVTPPAPITSLQFQYGRGNDALVTLTSKPTVIKSLKNLALKTTKTSAAHTLYIRDKDEILPLALNTSDDEVKETLCKIGHVVLIKRKRYCSVVLTLKNDDATVPVVLDLNDNTIVSTLKNLSNFVHERSHMIVLHVKNDEKIVTIKLDLEEPKTRKILMDLGTKTLKKPRPIVIPQANGQEPLLGLTLNDDRGRTVSILIDSNNPAVKIAVRNLKTKPDFQDDLFRGVDFNNQNTVNALRELSKQSPALKQPFVTCPAPLISISIEDVYKNKVVVSLNVSKPEVVKSLKHLASLTTNYMEATVIYLQNDEGKLIPLALDLTNMYVRKRLTEIGYVDLIKATKKDLLVLTLRDEVDVHPIILDLNNTDVLSSLQGLEKFIDAKSPITIVHVTDEAKNDVAIKLNLNNQNTKLILENLGLGTPNDIKPIQIPQQLSKNPIIALTVRDESGTKPILLDMSNVTVLNVLEQISKEDANDPGATSMYVSNEGTLLRINFKKVENINRLKQFKSPPLQTPFATNPSIFASLIITNNTGDKMIVTLNITDDNDLDKLHDLTSFVSHPSDAVLVYVPNFDETVTPVVIDPTNMVVRKTLRASKYIAPLKINVPQAVFSFLDDRGETNPTIIDVNDKNVRILRKLSDLNEYSSAVSAILVSDRSKTVPITVDLHNRQTREVLKALTAKTPRNLEPIKIPTLGGKAPILAFTPTDSTGKIWPIFLNMSDKNIANTMRVMSQMNEKKSSAVKVDDMWLDFSEENLKTYKDLTKQCSVLHNPFGNLAAPFLAIPMMDSYNNSVVVTLDTSNKDVLIALTSLSKYATSKSPVFYYYNNDGSMKAIALDVDNPIVKKTLIPLGNVESAIPPKKSVVVLTTVGKLGEAVPAIFDVDDTKVAKVLRNASVNVDYNQTVTVINAINSEGVNVPISLNLNDENSDLVTQEISQASPAVQPIKIPMKKCPLLAFNLKNKYDKAVPVILDGSNEHVLNKLKELNLIYSNDPDANVFYVPISEYRTLPIHLNLKDDALIKSLKNLNKQSRLLSRPHVATSNVLYVQIPDEEGYFAIIPFKTADEFTAKMLKTFTTSDMTSPVVVLHIEDAEGRTSAIKINPKNKIKRKALKFLGRRHLVKLQPSKLVPPGGKIPLLPIEIPNINGGTVAVTLNPNNKTVKRALSKLARDPNAITIIDELRLNLLNPQTSILLKRLSKSNPIQIINFNVYLKDAKKPLMCLQVSRGDVSESYTIDVNDPIVVDELKKLWPEPDVHAATLLVDNAAIKLDLNEPITSQKLKTITDRCPVKIIPVRRRKPFVVISDVTIDTNDKNTMRRLIEISKRSGDSSGTTLEFEDDDGFTVPIALQLSAPLVVQQLKTLKDVIIASVSVIEAGEQWPLASFSVLHKGVTTPVTLNVKSLLYLSRKSSKGDNLKKIQVEDSNGNTKRLSFDLNNLKTVQALVKASDKCPLQLYPLRIIPANGNAPLVMLRTDNANITLDVNDQSVMDKLIETSRNVSAATVVEIQYEDGKTRDLRLDLNDSDTMHILSELSNKSTLYVSPTAHKMPVLMIKVTDFEKIGLDLSRQYVLDEFEEITKLAGDAPAHLIEMLMPDGTWKTYKLDVKNPTVIERCRKIAKSIDKRPNYGTLVLYAPNIETNITLDIDNPTVQDILANATVQHGFNAVLKMNSNETKFNLKPKLVTHLKRLAQNVTEYYKSSGKPRLVTFSVFAEVKMPITLNLNDKDVINLLKKLSKLFKVEYDGITFEIYENGKRVLIPVDVGRGRVVEMLKTLSIPTYGKGIANSPSQTSVMLVNGVPAPFDPAHAPSALELLRIAQSSEKRCTTYVSVWDDNGQEVSAELDLINPNVSEKILRAARPTRNKIAQIDGSYLQLIVPKGCDYANSKFYLSSDNLNKMDLHTVGNRTNGALTLNLNLSKTALENLSRLQTPPIKHSKFAVLFVNDGAIRTPIYLNLSEMETVETLRNVESEPEAGAFTFIQLSTSEIIPIDITNSTTVGRLLKISTEVEHDIKSEVYTQSTRAPFEISAPDGENVTIILDVGSARTLDAVKSIDNKDNKGTVVKLKDSFGLPFNVEIDANSVDQLKALDVSKLHIIPNEERVVQKLLEVVFDENVDTIMLHPVATRLYTLDETNSTISLDMDLYDSVAIMELLRIDQTIKSTGVQTNMIDRNGVFTAYHLTLSNDATVKLLNGIFGKNNFITPAQYVLNFPDAQGVTEPFVFNPNSLEDVKCMKKVSRIGGKRRVEIKTIDGKISLGVDGASISKLKAILSNLTGYSDMMLQNDAKLNKVIDYVFSNPKMTDVRKSARLANAREVTLHNFREIIGPHLGASSKIFVRNEFGTMQRFNVSLGEDLKFFTKCLYEYLEDSHENAIKIQTATDMITIQIDDFETVTDVEKGVILLERCLRKSTDGLIYATDGDNQTLPVKIITKRDDLMLKSLILLSIYLKRNEISIKTQTGLEQINKHYLQTELSSNPFEKSLMVMGELVHFYDLKNAWYAYTKRYPRTILYTSTENLFVPIHSDTIYGIGDVSRKYFGDANAPPLYVQNDEKVLIPTRIKTSYRLTRFLEDLAQNASTMRRYDLENVLAEEITISGTKRAYVLKNSLVAVDLEVDNKTVYDKQLRSLAAHIRDKTRNRIYLETDLAYKKVIVDLKFRDGGLIKVLCIQKQKKLSMAYGALAKLQLLLRSYLNASNKTIYVMDEEGENVVPIEPNSDDKNSLKQIKAILTGYAVGAPPTIFVKNAKGRTVPMWKKNPTHIDDLISVLSEFVLGADEQENDADKSLAFLKSYLRKHPNAKIYQKYRNELIKTTSSKFYADGDSLAVTLNEYLLGSGTRVMLEDEHGKISKISLSDKPIKPIDMHSSKLVVMNNNVKNSELQRKIQLLRGVYFEPEFEKLTESDNFEEQTDSIKTFVKVLNVTQNRFEIEDSELLEEFRKYLRPQFDWGDLFKHESFKITLDPKKHFFYTVNLPIAKTKEQYEKLSIFKNLFNRRFTISIINKFMRGSTVKVSTIITYLVDTDKTLSAEQINALNVYSQMIQGTRGQTFTIVSSEEVINLHTKFDEVYHFKKLSDPEKKEFNKIIDYVDRIKDSMAEWDFDGKSNHEFVNFVYEYLSKDTGFNDVKLAAENLKKHKTDSKKTESSRYLLLEET